jgi:hypothetical protein
MPGYGIHSSGQWMLPWNHVDERMAEARNYWVAATRSDGRPHCAPVWGAWWMGRSISARATRSRKARNLSANPNIVVRVKSGDDVVILEGIAEEVAAPDPSLFAQIADALPARQRRGHVRPAPPRRVRMVGARLPQDRDSLDLSRG